MTAQPDRTGFRAVKAEILARITHGHWAPGSLIPGEIDLAESFGCARATVNRALRELSDMGYLDRRRKSGTRVRMAPLREARFDMPLVRAEIEASGAQYRYALVARETIAAPDWLRARLNLAPDSLVVHAVCVHHADGMAYQLEDRWINASALPVVLDQDFATAGPNEWLVATVPYSEVELSFTAIAAGALEETHLGFRPGEPVFRIERTTWWQGAAITHVSLGHQRGHRMTTRY